ncbi:MAG: dephospho-CoA kinase [Dehalococcoidia bacterium]|nr:dephospho-CoA kinase [Dehalococcoidia bacterium]
MVTGFGHDLVSRPPWWLLASSPLASRLLAWMAPDRTINRQLLGGKVFGDPAQMKKLTDIVWPEIQRLAAQEIADIKRRDFKTHIVLEAAVLVEANWFGLVDQVWVVTAEPSVAKARLMARNNLTDVQAQSRIDAQISNKERLLHAYAKFDNSSTLDLFRQRVEREWKRFTKDDEKPPRAAKTPAVRAAATRSARASAKPAAAKTPAVRAAATRSASSKPVAARPAATKPAATQAVATRSSATQAVATKSTTSDRQRALIEQLLSEAELAEAVVAGQWELVSRHAQSMLALDPSNPDGLSLTDAAERIGAATPTQVPPRPEPLPDRYSVGRTPDTTNPNNTHPRKRLHVARALSYRGDRHRQLGDTDAAIAEYTSVIEAYSDDTDPRMRLLVARAFFRRGIMHRGQDDLAAAITDYTSLIKAYSDDTDPMMRLLVAEALLGRDEMAFPIVRPVQARSPQSPQWSEDRLLEVLRLAVTYEFPLTVGAYTRLVFVGEIDGPTAQIFYKQFGSWLRACEAAGVESGMKLADRGSQSRWTDADLLSFARSYFTDTKHSGSIDDYRRWQKTTMPDAPSYGTLRSRLGSWSEVKRKAFQPGSPSDEASDRQMA